MLKIKLQSFGYFFISTLCAYLLISSSNLAYGASADWLGYADSGNGSSYVTRNTPTSTPALSWTFDYATTSGATFANSSEPVIYNDNIVIAVNKTLYQVSKLTGAVTSSMTLSGTIGYTTRTYISGNKIIVPLNEGITECVNLDTMTRVWTTPKITNLTQTTATIRSKDNFVYISTCDVNFSTSSYSNGHLQKINVNDGSIAWDYNNSLQGYYWTGPAIVGEKIVNVTSQGTVEVIDDSSGVLISSISLGSNVLCDCVYNASSGDIYVVSENGALNVLKLSTLGVITLSSAHDTGLASVQNTGLSRVVSTPVLADGNLIVGGQTATSSALSIVNLSNFSSTLITTSNGSPLPTGGVRGSNLVSKVGSDTYIYFTVNSAETQDYITYSSGGGIYMYKLGDTDASVLYDAAGFNQYCDSPVIADAQGNLFYINDSGNLFALSSSTTPVTPTPTPTPAPLTPTTTDTTPISTDVVPIDASYTTTPTDTYITTPTTSNTLAETGDYTIVYPFVIALSASLLISAAIGAYRIKER